MELLYKRALAQKFISLTDAKRFNDVELKELIVSDSINGATPQSLFSVDETIFERVKLQGDTISQSDFNEISTEQKQELMAKNVYPNNKFEPTILTNMPYVTRADFDTMDEKGRKEVLANRVEIKEPEEILELDANQLMSVLKRKDVKED